MKVEISITAFLELLDQMEEPLRTSIGEAVEMLDIAGDDDDFPHQVIWDQKPIEKPDGALLAEGHQVMILDDDVKSAFDIVVDEYSILIIRGDLQARNILVYGYLFVSGNVSCEVLFGASGNDHQTHVAGNLKCQSVVENGHYTLVEGEIVANELISNHNYIIGTKGLKVKAIVDVAIPDSPNKLHASVLHPDNYFDEEKFLKLIHSGEDYRLVD